MDIIEKKTQRRWLTKKFKKGTISSIPTFLGKGKESLGKPGGSLLIGKNRKWEDIPSTLRKKIGVAISRVIGKKLNK